MKKHYEIYRLDDPDWVSGMHHANGPLEALQMEQRLYPGSTIDPSTLTFSNEFGCHGVREADEE